MINTEKIFNELVRFNNDMDVGVFLGKFVSMNEKGMITFDGATGDFDIFISSALKDYEKMKALAHETGHIRADFSTVLSRPFVKEMGENRAENWACTYIIKYADLVGVLKNWRITNDFEAAEELHVDVETLRKATRRYELEGKPVKQWQFRECWGT